MKVDPEGVVIHLRRAVRQDERRTEEFLAGEITKWIRRTDEFEEEVEALRAAMESLFPTEEGFTEAFDELARRGLIVPVPADDAFREEWDSETMYVWRWSPLAITPTEEDDE